MRYALERVTEPAREPVTLAELKLNLRTLATDTTEDAMLSGLITNGREWVEDFTGRALIDQRWRLTLFGNNLAWTGYDTVTPVYPGYYCGNWTWGRYGELALRRSPALSIVSFVTVDGASDETAVDPDTYELREAISKWPRLVALNGATWSTWLGGDVRVTFRAGYVDESGSPTIGTVPARYKQAIKLHAEAHYDRDKDMMQKLLDAAENLIRPERAELSMA